MKSSPALLTLKLVYESDILQMFQRYYML